MNPSPNEPKFSVLMAVRAPAPWLVEALQSVAQQTLSDWELVCVLDGSSATVEEAVRSVVPRAKVLVLPHNSGVAAVRNEGLRQARGELIAVIDSDDTWPSDHLARHAEAFALQPQLTLRGTGAELIDSTGALKGERRAVPHHLLRYQLLVRNTFIHSSVAYVRRSAVEVGGYGRGLQVGEDYALWMRLARLGVVANDNTSLIGYRIHPNQISRRSSTGPGGHSLLTSRTELCQELNVPRFAAWALQRLWERRA